MLTNLLNLDSATKAAPLSLDTKEQYLKQYYLANKERLKAQAKARYDAKAEETKAQRRREYDEDKEKFALKNRKHYLENLDYYKSRSRLYSSLLRKQTPVWADKDAIRGIYASRPEGFHVDHIIPLRGKLVSGLHVENNLRVIPAKDNLQKGNVWNH